uniref:Uncharacterized protein n=1 Tax=Caenorhabditis japonica TaxID=281687 RepID=A0A8R1EAD7_CAEJA
MFDQSISSYPPSLFFLNNQINVNHNKIQNKGAETPQFHLKFIIQLILYYPIPMPSPRICNKIFKGEMEKMNEIKSE